jgi:hypothetical protein
MDLVLMKLHSHMKSEGESDDSSEITNAMALATICHICEADEG